MIRSESRARLWRPIIHFLWILLDRGRFDFFEPEGDDSGAASSSPLLPHDHSIEHRGDSRTDGQHGDCLQPPTSASTAGEAVLSVVTKVDARILMAHFPRTDNVLTDALSRTDTAGDHELLPDVARARGSNPTIDLSPRATTTSWRALQQRQENQPRNVACPSHTARCGSRVACVVG
jgi:hypothetical protein